MLFWLAPVPNRYHLNMSGSPAKQEISSIIKVDGSADSGNVDVAPTKASTHVFQALQYLLKLCSHPLLEILEERGIGSDASSSDGTLSVGQHRVLIFAQHKPDGSVVPEKRFEIVKAFNSDPTIDVLLQTTHGMLSPLSTVVGGLGLNLTSADTIVFMEHDWNPMRDHQAMDRAHRLGQKRVVNAHLFMMRGTLEEKVMSLQRFKVSVANTVSNAENASMKTMNTDQLLDLFASAKTSKTGGAASTKKGSEDNDQIAGTGKGIKAILGNLEELWDQSQYTEECV
ncbi:hypothetical protein Bca4012_040243 [Brassica carinata]